MCKIRSFLKKLIIICILNCFLFFLNKIFEYFQEIVINECSNILNQINIYKEKNNQLYKLKLYNENLDKFKIRQNINFHNKYYDKNLFMYKFKNEDNFRFNLAFIN